MHTINFYRVKFYKDYEIYLYEKDGILREYYTNTQFRKVYIGKRRHTIYDEDSIHDEYRYYDTYALICDKYKLLYIENNRLIDCTEPLLPDKDDTYKKECIENYNIGLYEMSGLTPENFYKATKHFKLKEKKLEIEFYKFIKSEMERRNKKLKEELDKKYKMEKEEQENRAKQLKYQAKILEKLKRR